jgi:uncharacterized protein involved in propanediol utilization
LDGELTDPTLALAVPLPVAEKYATATAAIATAARAAAIADRRVLRRSPIQQITIAHSPCS